MEYKQDTFIWSENWWIEKNKAWFVEQTNNMLFCVNLDTGECEEAIDIPDSGLDKYKLTPYCVKCNNDIFCIPGRGQNIWIYNLEDKQFSKICFDKPENSQGVFELWNWQDKVFLTPVRMNKIIELDTCQGRITNSYTICEDSIVRSTFTGDSIFLLSSKSNKVYQFNCSTKHIKVYTLPDIGRKFFNISFDGKRFILSGYEKELYTWNCESNRLAVINDFSVNFAMYDLFSEANAELVHGQTPTFFYARAVGDYVWFIPGRANNIVYMNKKNGELAIFEIPEETSLSLTAGLPQYLWEYVRDDRYIGLFSARNNRVVEIDTKELRYQWKDYSISNKCVRLCDRIFNKIYVEGNILHEKLYHRKLYKSDYNVANLNTCSIGSEIYKKLKRENE